LDLRKRQRRHTMKEEEWEEAIIPNYEIDYDNGDADGLDSEYE